MRGLQPMLYWRNKALVCHQEKRTYAPRQTYEMGLNNQDTSYNRNMKVTGKILKFLTLKMITLNENLLNHFLLIRRIGWS